MRRIAVIVATLITVLTFGGVASAQERDRWNVGLAGGVVNFDLSGTGNTIGTAIRAERALSPLFGLEVGALLARPDEQSGTSTLIAPEALLRAIWTKGRFSPTVGAGGGFVMRRGPARTRWEPSAAAAAGLRVRLTEQVSAQGEMRLRGIGEHFVGTTAEWTFGFIWRPASL